MERLDSRFFGQDVLVVAPQLLGMQLVRVFPSGETKAFRITDVEAYRGEEDLACHARKGKTPRTSVMYEPGGRVYLYLIYGMYWMLNIVTGPSDSPQAVLIRGLEGISGPGRVTRHLRLDSDFKNEDLERSQRLWITPGNPVTQVRTSPRIWIDYAGPVWSIKEWRFFE